MLDNAIRVSQQAPQLTIRHNEQQIFLTIDDHGPGMPEAVRQQLGQPFISTREDGTGLGLFLSHATINRLGGQLSILPSDHGTRTEIRLPWWVGEVPEEADA